jgi:hypothetical protein
MTTNPEVFLYNMPYGFPGRLNRVGGGGKLDVEAQAMDPTNYLTAYGLAGQIDAATGDFRIMQAGDTTIYGFLVAPYPTQPLAAAGFSGAVALGSPGVPPTSGVIDVMKSGYMTVVLEPNNAGVYTNPVKNGQVYICIQNPNAVGHAGGVQGAADGGNTIAINAYFMGPPDANNNVEIAFSISAKP